MNRKCQEAIPWGAALQNVQNSMVKNPSCLHCLWFRNCAPAAHWASCWADRGEEDVESSENVKETWPRLLQQGISCGRGCAPICTCNLHQSEVQPNKRLKGVWEVSTTGLLSCRAACQGCVAEAAVLTRMLFCASLGGLPKIRFAGQWAADPGPVTWGWKRSVLSFAWPRLPEILLLPTVML